MLFRVVLFAAGLLSLAPPAFATDRALLERRLHEIQVDPTGTEVFDLFQAVRRDKVPDDLKPFVLEALFRVIDVPVSRVRQPEARFRAGLALEGMGERTDRVQRALLQGMLGMFPLRQKIYRSFSIEAAGLVGTIQNPSESIVDLIVKIARDGGDSRGSTLAFEILIAWEKKHAAVRPWLDTRSRLLVEGSVATIEFWSAEKTKHARRVRAGRVNTAAEYLEKAEASYRQFKAWWPDCEHRAPDYAAAVPPTGEARWVEDLAQDDLPVVEKAARELLKYEAVGFDTLVALDAVRLGRPIDPLLRQAIKAYVRTNLVHHLTRFLYEEPERLIEIVGAPDQTSACLVFLAASRAKPE